MTTRSEEYGRNNKSLCELSRETGDPYKYPLSVALLFLALLTSGSRLFVLLLLAEVSQAS